MEAFQSAIFMRILRNLHPTRFWKSRILSSNMFFAFKEHNPPNQASNITRLEFPRWLSTPTTSCGFLGSFFCHETIGQSFWREFSQCHHPGCFSQKKTTASPRLQMMELTIPFQDSTHELNFYVICLKWFISEEKNNFFLSAKKKITTKKKLLRWCLFSSDFSNPGSYQPMWP